MVQTKTPIVERPIVPVLRELDPLITPAKRGFIDRLLPAPRDGGFDMPGYWIWCGSVIRGEDGRYHMFASRVPKSHAFSPNWLFNSEIVRAASDRPEGPYQFEEVVFERRGNQWFDGMNTHNPSIKRAPDGTYLLYYFGATYEGPAPAAAEEISHERYVAAWNNKRIGLATSTSVYGPWKRPDRPLLEPRPGKWDCTATTNPSAVILPDNSAYMIYKSRSGDGCPLQLGLTHARHWSGPYERVQDGPIFQFDDPEIHVEDPYLWFEDGRFHVLMKDDYKGSSSKITGEWGAGIYATSEDCIRWLIADPPKAYSRTVQWDDGTSTSFANLERPNLLIQNGKPTHLFCAAGEGSQPWQLTGSRSICIPLAT